MTTGRRTLTERVAAPVWWLARLSLAPKRARKRRLVRLRSRLKVFRELAGCDCGRARKGTQLAKGMRLFTVCGECSRMVAENVRTVAHRYGEVKPRSQVQLRHDGVPT